VSRNTLDILLKNIHAPGKGNIKMKRKICLFICLLTVIFAFGQGYDRGLIGTWTLPNGVEILTITRSNEVFIAAYALGDFRWLADGEELELEAQTTISASYLQSTRLFTRLVAIEFIEIRPQVLLLTVRCSSAEHPGGPDSDTDRVSAGQTFLLIKK
jgi:hypothetical protein